jgi:hypothetical protein
MKQSKNPEMAIPARRKAGTAKIQNHGQTQNAETLKIRAVI